MEGCYVSFHDESNHSNELLRVYPSELRRQYMPESTDRTMAVGQRVVQVMKMSYQTTDCIVRLRTKNGPEILSDAISIILDQHEAVAACFMPSNVTIDIAPDEHIEHLKKLIYFFCPNIKNTSKYGVHHLIELDNNVVEVLASPTSVFQPRGVPDVPGIPMPDGYM